MEHGIEHEKNIILCTLYTHTNIYMHTMTVNVNVNVKLLQGHWKIGLSVEMRYEFKSKNQPVYMQITKYYAMEFSGKFSYTPHQSK